MVKYRTTLGGNEKKSNGRNGRNGNGYKKLASVGRQSSSLINELYNPVGATNRFINLALQTVDENSQSRQFLLESKAGMRRISTLLRKLNDYSKKLEKEILNVGIQSNPTLDY